MDSARILAFVTGMVDQELLAGNEYLAAENSWTLPMPLSRGHHLKALKEAGLVADRAEQKS